MAVGSRSFKFVEDLLDSEGNIVATVYEDEDTGKIFTDLPGLGHVEVSVTSEEIPDGEQADRREE